MGQGTSGQTYLFETIGAIALVAPYGLCLLLLTIPRVRDFVRIRGLFEKNPTPQRLRKRRVAREATVAGSIATANGHETAHERDAGENSAAAEAGDDDEEEEDEGEAEEEEESERLGATTRRLQFRWWTSVLSAVLVVGAPAGLLHLVQLAPGLKPTHSNSGNPDAGASSEWLGVWIARTLIFMVWAFLVTMVAAFRPKLAHPFDVFDVGAMTLIALPVAMISFAPGVVPDVVLSLYPGTVDAFLQPWWPDLSLVRISAVTLLLFVFIRYGHTWLWARGACAGAPNLSS
jgi:hypothetical protein